MKNFNNPNEYHKYKSTTGGNGSNRGTDYKPSGAGWIVIIIVVIFLIHVISSGESDIEVYDRIIGFGILAYLFVNWLFK